VPARAALLAALLLAAPANKQLTYFFLPFPYSYEQADFFVVTHGSIPFGPGPVCHYGARPNYYRLYRRQRLYLRFDDLGLHFRQLYFGQHDYFG